MSEENTDEQIFKKSEQCSIKFDKNGNITIMGDCNGQTINRTEISTFNKVTNIIEDEENEMG